MALNIYQKLIEVRKACPYLKKEAAGFQFKYVSSSQTLGALRDEMDKQKLLLVPSIEKTNTIETKTKKGDTQWLIELTLLFTWINADNPEEKILSKWFGQGIDSGEKGVGKAVTYAEKYFLLKFFNIPTDKDDPDSFQKKTEANKPVIIPKITEANKRQIEAMVKDTGKTREDIKAFCLAQYGVGHFTELDNKMFISLMEWLHHWIKENLANKQQSNAKLELITVDQHRQLEAFIKEKGIDRSSIINQCGVRYGVECFSELQVKNYNEIMAMINQ